MLYEYDCDICGAELEAYRKIDDRHMGPLCCGQTARLVIRTAPYGFVDNMEEYRCPVTNQGVTTRRQRNEIMAREGLVDANDLLKSDEERDRQQAEYDAKIAKFKKEQQEVAHIQKDVDAIARQELNL
jgi:hypothetical protein